MTKEPKLDRAMRIAPEWRQYDFKLKKILERAEGTGEPDLVLFALYLDPVELIPNYLIP